LVAENFTSASLGGYLLLESGSKVLLESGSRVLLEAGAGTLVVGTVDVAVRGLAARFAVRDMTGRTAVKGMRL